MISFFLFPVGYILKTKKPATDICLDDETRVTRFRFNEFEFVELILKFHPWRILMAHYCYSVMYMLLKNSTGSPVL